MRRHSRIAYLCCCAAVLVGCAKDTDTASDTVGSAAGAAVTPASPATLSLSDVAGRWNARSVPETGPDTSATIFVLVATADTSGWSIAFPNREPIPTRVVAVGGDSIVTETGPFSSARRQGMQVRTNVVWRLQGDRLVGNTVARYVTTGPDSVLRLRSEATRAP